MSEKYKVIDSHQPTFITLTVIDWVDVFIRPEYTKILDEFFNYCIAEKGLQVHAYVYMTSHLHAIVSSNGEELQNIIRDFKKFTSNESWKPYRNTPWRAFAKRAHLPLAFAMQPLTTLPPNSKILYF